MLQHIESLSLLLDNFLLYIFYQAMFVKKKKEIHIIWLLLAFAGVDIVYCFLLQVRLEASPLTHLFSEQV